VREALFLLKLEVSSNSVPVTDWAAYVDIQTQFSLVNGADYVLIYRARHVGSGGNVVTFLSSVNTGFPTMYEDTLTSADTTFEEHRIVFTHVTGLTSFLVFEEVGGGNDGGVYISYLSVRKLTEVVTGELYTSKNAVNPLQDWGLTNDFSTTDAPTTFTTVTTPIDTGTYALEASSTNNVNWFIKQDLETDLSLVTGVFYKLIVRARHTGSGGDVQINLSTSITLASNAAKGIVAALTSSDISYASYSILFNLSGSETLSNFGVRENSGSNDGGAFH